MFNPVILGALLLQVLIRRVSRPAGAIVGFLITLGILLWGLAAYAMGAYMLFFGIELSQPLFLGLCVLWLIFDAVELLESRAPAAGPQS